MEKETYRSNIERVNELFANYKELVPITVVANILGHEADTLVRNGLRYKTIKGKNGKEFRSVPKLEIARYLAT